MVNDIMKRTINWALPLGVSLAWSVVHAASTPPNALPVLAKSDNTLAIVDPVTLKVVARMPSGPGRRVTVGNESNPCETRGDSARRAAVIISRRMAPWDPRSKESSVGRGVRCQMPSFAPFRGWSFALAVSPWLAPWTSFYRPFGLARRRGATSISHTRGAGSQGWDAAVVAHGQSLTRLRGRQECS
jgi:hypothetical protein